MAHVLVVEDDEKIRDIVTRFLKLKGHRVAEARDGEQAVAVAAREYFDVVFMDVKMPKLDGLSACQQVRAASPSTKVVLITGFTPTETLQHMLQEGIVEYVHKPFTFVQLEALMQRLMPQGSAPGSDAPSPDTRLEDL